MGAREGFTEEWYLRKTLKDEPKIFWWRFSLGVCLDFVPKAVENYWKFLSWWERFCVRIRFDFKNHFSESIVGSEWEAGKAVSLGAGRVNREAVILPCWQRRIQSNSGCWTNWHDVAGWTPWHVFCVPISLLSSSIFLVLISLLPRSPPLLTLWEKLFCSALLCILLS